MRITVVEQIPVGVVSFAGRRVAVAGDGTLLHDVGSSSLPTIPLQVAPGGTHLTGFALSEAQLLGAGPYQLLTRISERAGQRLARAPGQPPERTEDLLR